MNVTALLNGGVPAVDQQKPLETTIRLPTRSRTPWDAGGYSLPLNAATLSKDSSTSGGNNVSQICNDQDSSVPVPSRQQSIAPSSPVHKSTDSRSSLSSFASSTFQSTSHSRYSSISTLNSPRTLSVSLSEQLQLSPKASIESSSALKCPSEQSEQQRQKSSSHSPMRSLDNLAQIAEYRSSEEISSDDAETAKRQQYLRSLSSERIPSIGSIADMWDAAGRDSHTNGSSNVNDNHSRQIEIKRPSSPSDTLLIKRPTLPSLNLDIQDHLAAPYRVETRPIGRTHKRALSAPNFAAMNIRPRQAPMVHEPTPPTSNHPDHDSPPSNFQHSPPATPPSTHESSVNTEPTCMYIDDCDTDSPQRKAISHIFGRNKMCTRQIPERLWVHLCRKHYQRCRYRDANKWAKVQCDLVQIQIRRIHDWSMNNQLEGDGDGIVLQSWSLALRKREKMRREIIENNKRKRGASGHDDNEEVDRNDPEYPSTQTKVPDWLVDHCGREFSTQGILAIFNRLHQDVLDGHVGPQFPDIELLPNLLLPEDAPMKKVAALKVRKTHQRSQSLNTHSHESKFRDHAQKRRRPNEEGLPERVLHSLPISHGAMRRPTYPSIHEHEENGEHSYPPVAYQQRIFAPQPRQFDEQPIAVHYESGSLHPTGRPTHHRSQSDVTAFTYGRKEYMHSTMSSQLPFQHPMYEGHRAYQHRSFQEDGTNLHHSGFDDRDREMSSQERERQMSIPEDDVARYRQHTSSPRGRGALDRERSRFGHSRHNSSPAQQQRAQFTQPRYSPTPFSSQGEKYDIGLSSVREIHESNLATRRSA